MERKCKLKKVLKKVLCIVLILFAVYVVLGFVPCGDTYPLDNPMRTDSELPILVAHGGGNKEFPDNTLEAYYNAYSVDENFMIETDVSITKDGVVILSHDTTLDRKTNVTGNIIDWKYSDLIAQKVDFGYTNPTDENDQLAGERQHFKDDHGQEKYPTDVSYPAGVTARDEKVFLATTLEELLTAFPDTKAIVEIKQSGDIGMDALHEVLRILKDLDAYDRVVLASFHEEIYNEYQRLQADNEVPVEFMCSPGYVGSIKFFVLQMLNLDIFFGDDINSFQLPMKQYGINLATKSFMKNVHEHNLAVHYWTVNDVEDMHKLVEIKADGIITDYPHRLKEVLDTYR